MVDTVRTKEDLLTIFADGQPEGSINPQDMRDYVVTTDIVNTRFSTGLIDGGIVTVNVDDTKVDISAGEGFYTDNFTDPTNPARIKVAWSEFLAEDMLNLTLAPFTNFSLDLSSGTALVVKQNTVITPEERRDLITLVAAVHTLGVNVESIISQYIWAMDGQQNIYDLGVAIGQVNLGKGNVYSGNSDLTVNKSAGATFFIGINYQNSKKTPNATVDAAQTPLPFLVYTYRDGAGNFIAAPGVNIDPEFFDDGTGALASVGNNRFSIQRFYWLPEIFTTFVHYGQTNYATLATALLAINTEDFEVNPFIFGFRGWLVVESGTTDLSDPADAKFLSAGMFGDVLRS